EESYLTSVVPNGACRGDRHRCVIKHCCADYRFPAFFRPIPGKPLPATAVPGDGGGHRPHRIPAREGLRLVAGKRRRTELSGRTGNHLPALTAIGSLVPADFCLPESARVGRRV